MKVLIIGGTGLISTPITRMLLERGDAVTLFNRGASPRRFGDGARLITGDRREASAFEARMGELGSFDCVVDMVMYEPDEAESPVRAIHGRVLGAPPPLLVHIPTELLLKVAPERGRITAENFQFNNIFDNSAARADLGFRYTIPFVEGVRRIVAWPEQNAGIENSDDDPVEDRIIAAWERLGSAMVQELGIA